MSVRSPILETMEGALRASFGSSRVFDSQERALAGEEADSQGFVVIEPQRESVPARDLEGEGIRQLTIAVTVIAVSWSAVFALEDQARAALEGLTLGMGWKIEAVVFDSARGGQSGRYYAAQLQYIVSYSDMS